ncbi:MAG: hypothetical protein ABI839_04710 [Verrucomicrobiota bacterium]
MASLAQDDKRRARRHVPHVSRSRTPWLIGWEAAKANAVPALILQGVMLGLLIAYYTSRPCAEAMDQLARLKERHSFAFVVVSAICAGSLVPEAFLILFFQGGRPERQNLRNLFFTVPTWAIDGILVDEMYHLNALWFGTTVTASVVLAKICVDQFVYNPFLAAPGEVLIYEWKDHGFSWASLRRAMTWNSYRDKVIPTLLATWAMWFPMMAIIYSLPYPLQFPLFTLALSLWVLLLIYMTNKFAPRTAPPPLVSATREQNENARTL